MGSIPHSGNLCSGMCGAPCGHEGCWQCEEMLVKEAERLVKASQQRASKALATLRPVRPPSRTSATASYSSLQTATITREALQGLIDQVPGLQMQWNDGDPIVIRKQADGLAGRKLNDVHGDWVPEGGVLAEAVQKISADASKTIDQMVKDAMKGPPPEMARITGLPGLERAVNGMTALRDEVERVAREKAKQEEQRAREVLKAQGASDDDIEAARALLGWDPVKQQQFITEEMVRKATYGPHRGIVYVKYADKVL